MDELIARLIATNDTVIIPKLGALMASGKNEKRMLLFNQHLKFNDGMIANALITEQGISKEVAIAQIEAYAAGAISTINSGQSFTISGIGTLSTGAAGEIKFDRFTPGGSSPVISAPAPAAPPIAQSIPPAPINQPTSPTAALVTDDGHKNVAPSAHVEQESTSNTEVVEAAKLAEAEAARLAADAKAQQDAAAQAEAARLAGAEAARLAAYAKAQQDAAAQAEAARLAADAQAQQDAVAKAEAEKQAEAARLAAELKAQQDAAAQAEAARLAADAQAQQDAAAKAEAEKQAEATRLAAESKAQQDASAVATTVTNIPQPVNVADKLDKGKQDSDIVPSASAVDANSKPKASPTKHIAPEVDGDDDKPLKPSKKGKRRARSPIFWLFMLFILLISAAATYTSLNYEQVKGWLGMNDVAENTEEENANKQKPKDEKPKDHDTDFKHRDLVEDTENESTDTIENTAIATVEVEPEPEPEPAPAPKPQPEPKPKPQPNPTASATGNFHLIAGSFKDESNADKFLSELKNKGINSSKLGPVNGLFMVSCGSWNTSRDASSNIADMKEKTGMAVWVLKY